MNETSIYIMSEEYDVTKTDLENLKLALKSNKEYIYLDKDMSLEAGEPDKVYFYINRPVYIYSNLKNVLDIAIRITADNVTLDSLYLTREVRANSSFNDLTIKNCIINGSSAMGLHLLVRGEGTVCKNITIENCEFKNNAWHGLAFKGVIPSENKPSNGGDGTGQGTFENVIIRNCKSYNNGYIVQQDGTIISDHEYSAGIDLVDSCYKMKDCIVENCESYNNYSNGFHMESVAIKENVRIVKCKAYNNGKNPGGPHFGCGFSVVDKGVVLEECISKNNTVANYTSLRNQAHSPYKHYTGVLINCYDNDILINWNERISNQVYNGGNLIYNGNFRYGSMHYGFYYSTYCCWFYNMPNFLKRNGNETAYYESGIHMDNMNKPFIHGKFMTNLFKLKGNRRYKLTVEIDNSKNINNEELVIGLFKFNYVSDQDTKLNLRDESINKTLIKNSDCNSKLTTYTFVIDSDSVNNFVDGHYLLFFRNSSINSDSPMSLDGINPDELNIKIYNIKLEDIGFSSSIVAIYQTTDINKLPVFNDGYNYNITSTEFISDNLYRVTLSSPDIFSSCKFENDKALCNVEYLKITNNVNSLYRLFYGCTNLESVDFNYWDITEVETISQMFKNCDKLISLNLGVLNGKNIENFLGLFEGCDKLESVNLSGLINNKTTTIRGLFYDCKSLTTIMISKSDMTNITNIQNTCGSAKNINTVYARDCSEGSLATILEFLPEKTSNAPGIIYVSDIDKVSQVDITTAESKYWKIDDVQGKIANVTAGDNNIIINQLLNNKKIKNVYLGNNKIL